MGISLDSFDGVLVGKNILIVDDDPRNIYALSRLLERYGVALILAKDGYEALNYLDSDKGVDLILMDIMMPGMDGYETISQIRLRPDVQSTPIIAVTANAMPGDREKCLAAGANDYISKPIDISGLLEKVAHWLKIDKQVTGNG